ncbi:HAD family hydrolase [Haloimpatiens sp. FM7330]|uniref:HAD family hydrolase n=1 Tax=Haloimpatiens sp. FM7330 TaxID=3298610 RepID=UPI00363AB8C7
MERFKNVKTIFFDYDGTLHNSIKIYAPAFRKAYEHLISNNIVESKEFSEEEISYWLGFSSKDMWKNFMPDLEENIKNECSSMIGKEMTKLISENKAVLYEGALETLEYLKKRGYNLIFISNCGKYYRDMARDKFKLNNYFNDMICSEEYDFIPKYEILNKVKSKYSNDMVIIGDRIHDIEAGRKNEIYTIGCEYGFAQKDELKDTDLNIKDIRELKKIF